MHREGPEKISEGFRKKFGRVQRKCRKELPKSRQRVRRIAESCLRLAWSVTLENIQFSCRVFAIFPQEDDRKGGISAEGPELGCGGGGRRETLQPLRERAEDDQKGDWNEGAQKKLDVEVEHQLAAKVGQVELPKREDGEQVLHRLRVPDAEDEWDRANNLIPVRSGTGV